MTKFLNKGIHKGKNLHKCSKLCKYTRTVLFFISGENFIVIVKGATGRVTPEYVNEVGDSLISQSKVLVCQLEISIEATLAALRLGKKHGVTTIFNAAPGLTNLPKELFRLTDILCINEIEVYIYIYIFCIPLLFLTQFQTTVK